MERLSLKTKLSYSTGNLGIGLITGIHMFYLVYFFFPPKDSGISYVLPQGTLVFGLTILGLILFSNRIVDAFTDPWVANCSDNSQGSRGRRIPYMRRYAFPMALSYVLVFFVPFGSEITILNIIWVFSLLIASAIFITLYTVPYYTLLMEIAPHSDDKVDLGTLNSIFWIIGFQIAAFAPSLWRLPEKLIGCSKMQSVQITFLILAAFGLLFLYVPALLIDEKKLIKHKEVHKKIDLRVSVQTVFKNRDFMMFLSANTLYSLATYTFETGLIYYITILAMKDASVQGPLTTITGVMMLLSYPFVNKYVKKNGKKPILLLSFILFALTFALLSITGMFGINPWIMLGLLVFLSPIPQAALGMLPHVVTADCAAWDLHNNKCNNAGVYLAMNGFATKLGASFATIFFTAFLVFGKDIGNDLGIRIAALFGMLTAVGGFFLMSLYNEKKIMSYQTDLFTDGI